MPGLRMFFFTLDAGKGEFTVYKRVALVLMAVGLLLVAGCSKPPEMEMQNADTAMQATRAAEAEQYAPQAYRVAMDTLNAAQAAKQEQDSKFALFRSYGKAKQMFISAQALADKASTEARAEKERMRAEVADLITKTQAAVDAATKALDEAPVGKGNKADIELIRNDLASVNQAFADAKNDFNAEKYIPAKSKLETVMTRAQNIMGEIETAKTKKAGAKAAPKPAGKK